MICLRVTTLLLFFTMTLQPLTNRMDITSVLVNDPMHLKMVVSGSSASYMNAIRRIALSDILIPSVHTVDMETNDSDLVPEVFAHQIGMLAIRSSEIMADGEFLMDIKNDGTSVMNIYAHHLVPQTTGFSIVNPNTLLGYLSPDQCVRLRAYTKWGTAKEHSKWTCCHCSFYPMPRIGVRHTKPPCLNTSQLVASACPSGVFDIEDGGGLCAARPLDCMYCGECAQASRAVDGVEVTVDEKEGEFVFELESYGSFTSTELLGKVFEVLDRRLSAIQKRIAGDLPKLPSTPPSSPSETTNSAMCTY